jgi:predicted transglutaminase-like cysteine proteinase
LILPLRSISIIVIAAALAIAGFHLLVEAKLPHAGAEAAVIEVRVLDQARFYAQTLEQIGTKHSAPQFPPVADPSLNEWLRSSSSDLSSQGDLATRRLLDQLGSDLPQVGSATACVAYAGSVESLSESIATWAGQIGPTFNQFATHVFADEGSQQVGCAAVAVIRLSRFDPENINRGEKSFYSTCRLCGRSHIGSIEQTYGAASLTCPHCQGAYELLAFKVGGKVCRATELLTGWAPPTRIPKSRSKVDEMLLIWKAVLDRVRYSKDLQGLHGNLDTWQLADETWRYKNGDCEDSSILLADWLIGRGFDARVVIGTTDKREGHAWCVVNLEGTTYLLETTDANPDIRNLPYAAALARHYLPRFQFNRRSVFFRRDESPAPRYWSSKSWLQIDTIEEASQ